MNSKNKLIHLIILFIKVDFLVRFIDIPRSLLNHFVPAGVFTAKLLAKGDTLLIKKWIINTYERLFTLDPMPAFGLALHTPGGSQMWKLGN